MTLESVTAEQFRGLFGNVPELEQPIVFSKRGQKIIIPFDRFLVDDDGHDHRIGVLETSPYDNRDLDPSDDPNSYSDAETLIRVRYDNEYGLKARTWQAFRKISRDAWSNEEKQEPELLLLSGDMKYDLGPISIVLSVAPLSPLHAYDLMLRKPSSYSVSINVLSASGDAEKMPPLARISYNLNDRQIPFHAEYVDVDYDEALQGKVDQRPTSAFNQTLEHQSIYYQWIYLVGARIGMARFKDDTSGKMHFSRWPTQINAPEAVSLEGTPYKANIYHGYAGKHFSFTEGILSFARINTRTRESWIFSVPEWIDNEDFIRNLSQELFRDFFFTYPVVFGVRRLGQEDQWFSTRGDRTREKEILHALSAPSLPRMITDDPLGSSQ